MNFIDRFAVRRVALLMKKGAGKILPHEVEDAFGSGPTDEQKLEAYEKNPMVKAVVNLYALLMYGQGISCEHDNKTIGENNKDLIESKCAEFMLIDRAISLCGIADVLVEWDEEQGLVLTPIPISHVKTRPSYLDDRYTISWDATVTVPSFDGLTETEEQRKITQVYSKEDVKTYFDESYQEAYSYPNTIKIHRIVTFEPFELPGKTAPLIGKFEYNVAELYRQALNALSSVTKLTGTPTQYATGTATTFKPGDAGLLKDDKTGETTINVPSIAITDPSGKLAWTEPPKGIPEIISFLEILFWLFIENTGVPEGSISSVTGMNSTSNQLQVFIKMLQARQKSQKKFIQRLLYVAQEVNNLNSPNKVDFSGKITYPEIFPDVETIKEIVIELLRRDDFSTQTTLELIRERYLKELPEWTEEQKRIDEQRKSEYERDAYAHHSEDDVINDDDDDEDPKLKPVKKSA